MKNTSPNTLKCNFFIQYLKIESLTKMIAVKKV